MTLRVKRTIGRRDPRKGFTLIELLVVIAIIGILAAVVLVSLNSARARGRDARRISDMQSVALAMELFADANGALYPSDGDVVAPSQAGFTTVATTLSAAGNRYLPSIPADPVTGNVYFADVPTAGNGDSFILGTDLEQDNPACATDYDGVSLEGASAIACADGGTGANHCGGYDGTGTDGDGDFCICSGPSC